MAKKDPITIINKIEMTDVQFGRLAELVEKQLKSVEDSSTMIQILTEALDSRMNMMASAIEKLTVAQENTNRILLGLSNKVEQTEDEKELIQRNLEKTVKEKEARKEKRKEVDNRPHHLNSSAIKMAEMPKDKRTILVDLFKAGYYYTWKVSDASEEEKADAILLLEKEARSKKKPFSAFIKDHTDTRSEEVKPIAAAIGMLKSKLKKKLPEKFGDALPN
jgi:hypothetical protein